MNKRKLEKWESIEEKNRSFSMVYLTDSCRTKIYMRMLEKISIGKGALTHGYLLHKNTLGRTLVLLGEKIVPTNWGLDIHEDQR